MEAAHASDLTVAPRRAARWREPLARPVSDNTAFLVPGIVFLVVAALASSSLGEAGATRTFAIIFTSIVVEALPFILLGALVSGTIAVLAPDKFFARVARLPLALQIPGATVFGLAFPVCECGSVPVARRLALRGVHPSAAVAFMIAAPIMNPIVIVSTLVAFQGNGGLAMAASRVSLGLLLALAVGAVVARTAALADLVSREPDAPVCSHDHEHRSHGRDRIRHVAEHASADFVFMGRFVIVGAALSALLQTAVPQSVIADVIASPAVGVLLLMLLAFLLSLCSESDAFVAASFAQFTPGAQLAFLVLGPALDVKLSVLYGATFGRRFLITVVLVAVPLVFAGAMLAGVVLR
jgi:uncharacterized protein